MTDESKIELPDFVSKTTKAKIVHAVKNNIPIIVSGNQGPTGKTTLKNIINSAGGYAFEEWECERIELNERLF